MEHWNRFLEQWKKTNIQNLPPFMEGHRNLTSGVAGWRTQLNMALESNGERAKQALQHVFSRLPWISIAESGLKPAWASVSMKNNPNSLELAQHENAPTMTIREVEERLAGVPVYGLINSNEDFVLVSCKKSGKSLGLFCFREEDAECFLEQLKSLDPGMQQGSKVVPVALNKVVQLKVDGVSFRFVPDPSQVEKAVKLNLKSEEYDRAFPGIPVFQSKSLVLRSQGRRYRPVFFRKEDLERSLYHASHGGHRGFSPALRHGDTQVLVMEDIISEMLGNVGSTWSDIVFIPPGFDISTIDR